MIAAGYERIHRSNLIGMGVLPLQFEDGVTADTLGLTGEARFSITGIAEGLKPGSRLTVRTEGQTDGKTESFEVLVRLDTDVELEYYRHGGILSFVLRKLAGE